MYLWVILSALLISPIIVIVVVVSVFFLIVSVTSNRYCLSYNVQNYSLFKE